MPRIHCRRRLGREGLSRAHQAAFEALERRRVFSSAPVGLEDVYELGADHRLSVDVTAPPARPAFDETTWTEPVGPFLEIGPGEVVTEEDPVGVGYLPSGYGDVTVAGRGARWDLRNWLEVGDQGRGSVTVEDGGSVHVANWTEIGDAGGYGTVTLSGGATRWTSGNWITVGGYRARGILRIEDGATHQ